MARIAYVSGQYCDIDDAFVHIEDRGYQFSDAVYEAWSVRNGRFMDLDWHLSRLWRSLAELKITAPCSESSLRVILREVVRRNRLKDALVYLQISRGRASRDHKFPVPEVPPVLVITAKPLPSSGVDARASKGVKVITVPDERWKRRDIKTVSLLPNVLAKQAAHEAGAFEAWMVDDEGYVTEGTSTSAWIINTDNQLITRQKSSDILWGVTRRAVIAISEKLKLEYVERAFKPDEAYKAKEAFLTSATGQVMPVIEIDGHAVGEGKPGQLSLDLRDQYFKMQDEFVGP